MLCYIFLGVWLFCTLFSIHLGHRFSRFHFPMIFTILVSNVIYERGSCVYRHQHKYRLVGQFFITSSLKCVAHFSFKSLRHFFLCFVCVFFVLLHFFLHECLYPFGFIFCAHRLNGMLFKLRKCLSIWSMQVRTWQSFSLLTVFQLKSCWCA